MNQLRYFFPFALTCSLFSFFSASGQVKNSGEPANNVKPIWSVGAECMPENLKAFEENKGQYSETAGNKILFGCNYQGMNIRLDKKGIVYQTTSFRKLSEKEMEERKEKAGKNEEQEEKEHNVKLVFHNVSLEFEGANPNPLVEGSAKTPYYFGGLDASNPHNSIGEINGYGKVTYHDMYPGIDVVFSFQEKHGIEYSINIKPGYNASAVKMHYTGQDKLSIDNKGNICVGISGETITDHAPVTTQDGKEVSSSFYMISKDEIGFKLGATSRNSEIVIDPAVTWTTPIPGTYPTDCGMDAASNTYVLVCTGSFNSVSMAIQKYNPGGGLVWSINLAQYPTTTSASDLAVDPAGNTYVVSPYFYSNSNFDQYAMVSYNTGGILNYFYNTYASNAVFESWNLAYSCDYSTLVMAGSPQILQGQSALVNPANGNLGPVTNSAAFGEIYGGCVAPNGLYYCLASNTQFEPGNPATNDLICYNVSGPSPVQTWTINSAYSFDDYEDKTPVGIPVNAVAASCAFLYTYDGVSLEQRNLANGALINTVAVPGGSNTSSHCVSGVAVDPACGTVYAGTTNNVYVYTSTLGGITNYAVNGKVYDVCFDNNLVSTCGSNAGTGFVAQFPAQTCIIDTKTRVNATCMPTGTASVTPLFCVGPYTYTWSNGATTSSITGLSAGTYTVTMGTAGSCVTEKDTVLIKSTPLFALSLTETGVKCFGDSTGTATVTPIGGSAPYTYAWTPVGGTNATATGLSAGTYTVSVTDASPCTVTASVTITQVAAIVPVTSIVPANCGVANGSASVVASGGAGGTYTYNWTPVGGTNATATGLLAGNYTVTVTDSNNCAVTAGVIVTTIGGGTVNISPVVNELCNGGSTGTLTANPIGGTGPFTYIWTPVGGTNVTATGLSAGTYTVTLTDANGCVCTASATITQPTLLTVTAGPVTNITCNGANNGSIGSTPGGGTGAYTYSWSTIPVQTNATSTGLSAGTYTITVTDANNCTGTASATVTEPPALTASTSFVQSTCGNANGSATVTAGGGIPQYTYNWSNAQTTSTATALSAGTYNVTVTDSNHCTITTSVNVTNIGGETVSISSITNTSCNGSSDGSIITNTVGGNPPYTYAWTPVGGSGANATGLSADTYTITVTDANGCISIANATVTQPNVLAVSALGAQTICIGQTATLTANPTGGTPNFTYNWTPAGGTNNTANVSPNTTTTYTVTVNDANNCGPVTATVIVTVNPPLGVVMSPPTHTCPGGSVLLTATPSGGDGTYSYAWAPGGGTTGTITVNPVTTTVYTVTVSDNCGDVPIIDSVKVTVDPVPVVNFKADTLDGCSPLCINFTDLSTITSGTITAWSWNFGNGTSNLQNPANCYPTPGIYTVSLMVSSNNGCTASDTIKNMITVYSHPIAKFTETPQPTTISDPLIFFTDQSTDSYGPIVSWSWLFGDATDNTSNLQNPSHIYSDTGTYCANLKVTNKYGCTDSITNCLVIMPAFSLYIPSAFTPNGNGINDVFLPRGEFVYNYKLYIFDRWGNEIYYSEDIYQGWDGTKNSTMCQEDTYVYLIECDDNLGKKHSYIGRVSLIR